MKGEILLTGATGFIGSGLLAKWLRAEPDLKFAVLARGRRGESPTARMERILGELSPEAEGQSVLRRVAVLEGDIALPRLGLTDDEYAALLARTSRIVHCAAAVRFDLPIGEARAINVGGCENILALARSCESLERLDYVGTAFVAGKRTGLVPEDDLDVGQEHNNTYERTKLEAEAVVRRAMRDLPVTVYRPSIVLCDSRTGRISRHSAFFRVLRMYGLGRVEMLPGSPSTLMDLVPLDYVVDAISEIARSEASLGRCYHVTAGSNRRASLAEVSALAGRHFGRPEFVIVSPSQFENLASKMADRLSEDQRDMLDEVRLYAPYLASQPEFDNANTLEATDPAGLSVPSLGSYFGKLTAYVRAGLDD
jgi:thioester reductase-like protein